MLKLIHLNLLDLEGPHLKTLSKIEGQALFYKVKLEKRFKLHMGP